MLSRTVLRGSICIGNYQRILCSPICFSSMGFHTTQHRLNKIFVDRENQHAHDILRQSLKPYQIFKLENIIFSNPCDKTQSTDKSIHIITPQKSASEITEEELFNDFSEVMRYILITGTCLSNKIFEPFVTLFCEASHKLSDDHLIECLQQLCRLPELPSVKSSNYCEVWNNIDVECCRRIESWNSKRLLFVCDIWYTLNLARICEFVWQALRKLNRKVRKMPPEQLVQSMFLCNVMRRPLFEMFEFENNLISCVSEMSLAELGVMSMGFFKTQTPIRNPALIEILCDRIIAEKDSVDDITLCAILKVLRYSSRLPQVDILSKLLDALEPKIEKFSLLCCLHIGLLGSDLQYSHDRVVERILQRFDREIDQARLKDLERICLIIGIFNFHSESRIEDILCEKVLITLRTKIDEIMRHPRCFANCLHFLSLVDTYDEEMISSVLDPKFVKHCYGNNIAMGREIFNLDSFVKINLRDKNYKGNQLNDKIRKTMGKMLTHYIPERNSKFKLSTTDRILMEIKETTDLIFRSNCIKHILPHYQRPDILVCYDREKRKPLPLSAECAKDYSGVILTREEILGEVGNAQNVDTVAIVVAGWNNVVRGKDKHTGLFDMKLKQLHLLGHKYVVVYWYEWTQLETKRDRVNYLMRRLATVINI